MDLSTGSSWVNANSGQLFWKHCKTASLHPLFGASTSVVVRIKKSSTYLKMAVILSSFRFFWMVLPHAARNRSHSCGATREPIHTPLFSRSRCAKRWVSTTSLPRVLCLEVFGLCGERDPKGLVYKLA